jgi:hypothetical protein
MITRSQMRRQLRAKGGIMNVAPREKFGIGSKIKDRFRKLIPNELADVAVKAAPFVAPFFPGYAAIARGIGRFDQRGSISDALKQGALTYGFGKGIGKLGGASGSELGNVFGRQQYSMEGFKNRGLGRLFQEKQGVLTEDQMKRKRLTDLKNQKSIENTPDFMKKATESTIGKVPGLKKLPPMVQQKLLVGGITSGASALYSYFTGEFEPQQPGETMEEYMARRNARVKQQMRGYMDSYYTPLRNPQYAAMSDEEKDNYINSITGQGMATGGRVGLANGNLVDPRMKRSLAENVQKLVTEPKASNIASRQNALEKFAELSGYNKHMKEDRMLKDANIDNQLMNRMGGLNVTQANPGLGLKNPAGPGIGLTALAGASGLYQAAQTLMGNQSVGEALKDTYENTMGQTILSNPKQLAQYNEILGKTTTPTEEAGAIITDGNSKYKINADGSRTLIGAIAETTPTPDASGKTYYDDGSYTIPGFTRLKNPDGAPGNYNEFMYKGPDGQIYGSETYGAISAGRYPDIYDPNKATLAGGGMPMGEPRVNQGGITELDYRAKGGFVPVGIKEKADDVPAMLSKNEFVFTADAVRGAGNGSVEKGAQKMYDTMKNLERRVT